MVRNFLRELATFFKQEVIQRIRIYTILLVGLLVFAGAAASGARLFGDVIGLGLGFVCAMAAAVVLGDRLPDPYEKYRQ